MNLNELALQFKCAKMEFNYPAIYEKMFAPFRAIEEGTLFEIGVQFGASMNMWRNWFPKAWKIVGIDTDENCLKFNNPEENLFIENVNATYEEPMEQMVEKYGPYDIVIDDGGHGQRDQLKAFSLLWDKVKPGGLYVIEDLHCAYIDFFCQDLPEGKMCQTIFDFSKQMHDQKIGGKVVSAVHWFPSIVFIEKGK